MPINSTHPQYNEFIEDWITARDCFDGAKAVKAAGVRYLPKLTGQQDPDYKAYKNRATFYSITAKTISALVGMALDEYPEFQVPEKLNKYFIDNSGLQFSELLHGSLTELLLTARVGCLVDMPQDGGSPYTTLYTTENIINWRTDDIGNLTMLVLRETFEEIDKDDPYVVISKVRYRELYLQNGQLVVKVHVPSDGKDAYEVSESTISVFGQPIDFIPFVCVSPIGLDISPSKPPVMDIVDINLSHYRTSADLEHGRHFTGLPTPYITGGQSDKPLYIGSTAAWVIPDAQAKVGYLEFLGQGLASLENALKEKQGQLASLSARLIDNSTRGSEAAETVRLRYLSETASLKGIVRSIQAYLNKVYSMVAIMTYGPDQFDANSVKISMKTEFLSGKLSAQELNALTKSYIEGGISREVLIYNLRQGKAVPQGLTDDRIVPITRPTNSAEV